MDKAERDLSILTLSEKLRTEADAYKFLEELRWGDKPLCPHCGSVERMYFLKPANGSTRATRTGTASERRVWKCAACRKQFSVLTGTVLHGSKIAVRTWIFVIFEMCSSKNGVAAREIERKYGLTPKSAWHMLHRIRFAMERDPLAGLLSGRVVVDETWFGGKPSNRHGYKRGQGRPGQARQDAGACVARDRRGSLASSRTCKAATCASYWTSTWTR
jgi:transposase-like protein